MNVKSIKSIKSDTIKYKIVSKRSITMNNTMGVMMLLQMDTKIKN